MSKSIFTMSAAQRLKAQKKQSRRFDRAVNKKFKEMKKAWKRKIAGRVVKGVAFVAIAAAAGAVISKAKEIIKTKSGDELREMAAKIKVKFDERKAKKWDTPDKSKTAAAAEMGAELGRGAAAEAGGMADTADMDGVSEAAAVNVAADKTVGAAVIDAVAAEAGADGIVEQAPENNMVEK